MILVTGASGTVGGEVLRLLAVRGTRIRAMTREPVRLRRPGDALIDVVQADFERADSLHSAVAGVDSVFLLTTPGPGGSVAEHDGAAHTLTGPELLSVPDQVTQLATELRRTITTVDVPAHAVRQQLVSAGFDPSVADSAVDGYQLIRHGGNAVVTDEVERILGRPARAFRAWARDHRTAFVAGEGHP